MTLTHFERVNKRWLKKPNEIHDIISPDIWSVSLLNPNLLLLTWTC